MILVDSNILIDVFEKDPNWWLWSLNQLETRSKANQLVINQVAYAELASVFSHQKLLDQKLTEINISVKSLPNDAAFLAGMAFIAYKKRGGARNMILADFFIGAHAMVLGCPLLTRDIQRYATYFPRLRLIAP